MIFTLTLVILATSIVVFFAEEFAGVFKKIFAFPILKLLLPLVIASWLIETYENFGLWALIKFKDGLYFINEGFTLILPLQQNCIQILQLFLIAAMPLWIMRGWEKSKGIPVSGPYTPRIGLVVWLVSAITITAAVYQ